MRAVVITEPGEAEVLQLQDRPLPIPGRGEVRVRIRACAVNRADLLQRQGLYPAPPGAPPDIPGLEFAGELDALGDGVAETAELALGQPVFGLCAGGAYAEAVVVHSREVTRLPRGMSFTDAAAVPEAFVTAWDALLVQAGLRAGESVLIHAAGSGVGTAAVQIARTVGARVLGTARTAEKLQRALALGLDEGVQVADGAGFAPSILQATGKRGVDVVLELVGGRYLAEDLACVGQRARIVLVGLLAGARAELDLRPLLNKRARIFGTVLRSRPLEEKIEAVQQLARHLVPLLERGALAPVVHQVLPLAQAADAHALVASGSTFGKVVLAV